MKISVLTAIGARAVQPEPLLVRMAAALRASLQRADAAIELEWVIVAAPPLPPELRDAVPLSDEEPRLDKRVITVAAAPGDVLATRLNQALAAATGSYVVVLEEGTLVTADWVATCAQIASKALGWNCKQLDLTMAPAETGKPFQHGTRVDSLRPVPVITVGGACWGAPKVAFDRIGGFDLIYDGESYGVDLDAAIRLSRIGITFVATAAAIAVHIKPRVQAPTKQPDRGVDGRKLVAWLQRDHGRVDPVRAYAFPPPAAKPTAAPTPAPKSPNAARRARQVRASKPPTIVKAGEAPMLDLATSAPPARVLPFPGVVTTTPTVVVLDGGAPEPPTAAGLSDIAVTVHEAVNRSLAAEGKPPIGMEELAELASRGVTFGDEVGEDGCVTMTLGSTEPTPS